ncbi:MAG: YitT family protein [Candidatus Omnitrophica bacterium]|nr:YitT family protein [Candidatus Omnitrophota bacterium]
MPDYRGFAGRFFKRASEYAAVIFAGALYAIAIKYFIFPSKVIMTGTEGISIATAYFFDNGWLFIGMYSFFQSILIIFAFFKIGFRFAFRSLLVVCSVILLLTLLPEYQFANPEPQNERIILVIFGGILAGIAKAIAFRYSASTADEDIPAAYFSMKYLRPVGNIAVFAAVISTLFGICMAFIRTHSLSFVINTLMYTGIYIFMCAETLNNFYRKIQTDTGKHHNRRPREDRREYTPGAALPYLYRPGGFWRVFQGKDEDPADDRLPGGAPRCGTHYRGVR